MKHSLFGNGFPVTAIINEPSRPKSQPQNKNPSQNPVKIGNFVGKMMTVKENRAKIFLLPYIYQPFSYQTKFAERV